MKIITNLINWIRGGRPATGVLDTAAGTITPAPAPAEPVAKARRTPTLKLDYGVTERGAWWGRPDELPRNPDGTVAYDRWKLHLCQVPRGKDGCDKGGAFWGKLPGPGSRAWCPWGDDDHDNPKATVWCAWSDEPSRIRMWMWAVDRARAKEIARGRLPHANFYR